MVKTCILALLRVQMVFWSYVNSCEKGERGGKGICTARRIAAYHASKGMQLSFFSSRARTLQGIQSTSLRLPVSLAAC